MRKDSAPEEADQFLDELLASAPKFPSLSFWTKKELVVQKRNFGRTLTQLEKLFAHKNGLDK